MIKRLGIRAILYCALLYTGIVAGPRIHFGSLPASIEKNSLISLSVRLSELRPMDVLVLKIDTVGGSVGEFMRFKQAKEASKGTLICTISHQSSSAGAMIMQLCDKVYMNKNAKALFHMPRYYERDESPDGAPRVTIRVITENARNLQELFIYLNALALMDSCKVKSTLTEKQYEAMLKGTDIIIGYDQLKEKHPEKFIGWQ